MTAAKAARWNTSRISRLGWCSARTRSAFLDERLDDRRSRARLARAASALRNAPGRSTNCPAQILLESYLVRARPRHEANLQIRRHRNRASRSSWGWIMGIAPAPFQGFSGETFLTIERGASSPRDGCEIGESGIIHYEGNSWRCAPSRRPRSFKRANIALVDAATPGHVFDRIAGATSTISLSRSPKAATCSTWPDCLRTITS